MTCPGRSPSTTNQPTNQPPSTNLLHPVVGRFLRNLDVVHVALAGAGGRDANHLSLPLQFPDRRAAAVPHPGAEPAHELVDHGRDAALVCHAPFDPLGHELLGRAAALQIEFVLEVAIAAAAAHRADGAHASILLVAAALEEDQLAGTLVGAGKQIAD